MKNIIIKLTAIAVTLGFAACEKSETNPTPENSGKTGEIEHLRHANSASRPDRYGSKQFGKFADQVCSSGRQC